ncbi:MAG: DUF2933 domain-containing protein [Pseudonocardia sp.]
MNKSINHGLFAVAVAIAVVGALWLGMPVSTIAVLGLVLVCPLMMMLMMRGMHGGDEGRGHDSDERRGSDDQTGVR